jgi:hypothetical protein
MITQLFEREFDALLRAALRKRISATPHITAGQRHVPRRHSSARP